MTTPWMQYVRSSGLHPHLFYRDRVHANAFGEQILAKILMSWWTDQRKAALRRLADAKSLVNEGAPHRQGGFIWPGMP
jgi:hypothetical protein